MQSTLPASPSAATQPDRATVRPEPWQRELAEAIRDPRELCRMLDLAEHPLAVGRPASAFPLLVPKAFAARMRRGDPRDPLLLQVLPQAVENDPVAGFVADPLQEADVLAAPGLVRKYAGRALLLVTGGCAVHCRYCFRREFPYAASGATRRGIDEAFDAIAADPSLAEVILSGGDPLLADDAHLAEIVARLDALPHVRRLRIHTRLPIVLPARVSDGLLEVLAGSRLARIVVVHANHPAELDDSVAEALRRLAVLPCTLLNQAVLLGGVNDSADVLRALSERLVELGVLPYYLHMLDRVRGAAHFEVTEARARELHGALRDTLPGYAVPRLAREVPGAAAKVWLA
ncbi:MAG: EF-P beta-lysylation protein EpmB [Planctomycetia bacterium]|nr:EF-P beta-lysylation protein EpmB [Planctomycetia bacterium]